MKDAKLKILRTGDAASTIPRLTPDQILETYGPPTKLLSNSSKSRKCQQYGVLNEVLYLTPGVFCPAATSGCLASCLGHSSGRMAFPTHVIARDRRTALYLTCRETFLWQLRGELTSLAAQAKFLGLTPAVRLNGSSDLPWEHLHSDLFHDFPQIQFFDYTKIRSRIKRFLSKKCWPVNYHLTFSADGKDDDARAVLAAGGTVAAVFWPELPKTWWNYPVIDGDTHDARFLDPKGVIVGLTAKGLACVDTTGFVIRPCPRCSTELNLHSSSEDTHLRTLHRCDRCQFLLHASRMKPAGRAEERGVAA